MKKINILHITPHLGGGAGNVIINFIKNSQYNHIVWHLEDSINEKALKSNIHIVRYNNIDRHILKADVIIIHFWNHPLLWEMLLTHQFPPCRLVIWSHVSGLQAPNIITKKLIDFSDKFILTTPYSQQGILKDLDVIWSTGGLEHITAKSRSHDIFTIGYVGTVDYSKMHKDFIQMHQYLRIPNYRVLVVGDGDAVEEIKAIGYPFECVGKVENINSYLEQMDVFGYPLQPNHFGTCEQVLGEAMYAGLIPVVFDNGPEHYIISNCGLYVTNIEEYRAHLVALYKNQFGIKDLLQIDCRARARHLYSTQRMIDAWHKVINEMMYEPKLKYSHKFSTCSNPYDGYIESIGGDVSIIDKSQQWTCKTKGSPQHWSTFFPDDLQLQKLVRNL